MATITTQNMLDENNWSTSDISLVKMGYMLDNAIHYVNLRCGTSISDTAGGSVTLTNSESIAVKAVTILMAKAFIDRGPNTSISSLSVTSIVADPQYSFWKEIVELSLERLAGHDRLETRSLLKT